MRTRDRLTLFEALLRTPGLVAARGAPGSPDTVSRGGPVSDQVSLVDALPEYGDPVETAGDVSQRFLSVEGQVIGVDGHHLRVFEYADEAAAEGEAALVSPDGRSVGTSLLSWVATPHFFQAGRLLVLYVGDEHDVVALLENVLGPRFAGG